MILMGLRRAIAVWMLAVLPLGTPAAAWAAEACCRGGVLATVTLPATGASAPCHGEPAPTVAAADDAASAIPHDAAAAADCRMDHTGVRPFSASPDVSGIAALLIGAPSQSAAPAPMAAGAADRAPPERPKLLTLCGILRI